VFPFGNKKNLQYVKCTVLHTFKNVSNSMCSQDFVDAGLASHCRSTFRLLACHYSESSISLLLSLTPPRAAHSQGVKGLPMYEKTRGEGKREMKERCRETESAVTLGKR